MYVYASLGGSCYDTKTHRRSPKTLGAATRTTIRPKKQRNMTHKKSLELDASPHSMGGKQKHRAASHPEEELRLPQNISPSKVHTTNGIL